MKKLSNIKLIGILVALVLIYFVIDMTGGKQKSKSLRTSLVEIDTAAVTKLQIVMPEDTVLLEKTDGYWNLALDNGKVIPANKPSVMNALNALTTIKPSRMATKSETKWKDYQVDSAGTRAMVYEGGEKTLDLIIGRFGMQSQRQYHTFVRLFEDKEVYVAENFMSFSVPKDANSYRDGVLARINKDSITSVTFNYPADTSFILQRAGDIWNLNGETADSTAVAGFVSGLSYLSGRNFYDDPETLINPLMTAEFALSNGKSITIVGYDNNDQMIYHSSENEFGYFSDAGIRTKVFKGPSELK